MAIYKNNETEAHEQLASHKYMAEYAKRIGSPIAQAVFERAYTALNRNKENTHYGNRRKRA